jgi:hypothetical protein
MSRFILIVLTLAIVACGETPYEKQKRLLQRANFGPVYPELVDQNTDNLTLAPKDTEGVSKNTFSFDFQPSPSAKRLYIHYGFNAGYSIRMRVMRPSVSAEGCDQPPKLRQRFGSDPKGLFFDEDIKNYGEYLDVEKYGQQNIVLIVTVDGTCTRVTGSFDVQFR